MAHKSTDFTKRFEYRTLHKIHGEPTYATLKRLKDQLRTNASGISSNLGGGNHGHLGLILTNAEYANVSPVPYVRPPHPGPLVIPPAATARQETGIREDYKLALKLFHDTIDLERALKNQITESIDSIYTEELRDPTTNTYNDDIPTILQFFITNYGDVRPDEVIEEESNIRRMDFNVTTPLTTLYKRVEDLLDLSGAAHMAYTPPQLINIGLHVIQATGDYKDGIKEWYQTAVAGRTWLGFKQHFQRAKRLLRQVRGPTMRDADYGNANQLTQSLKNVEGEIEKLQATQKTVLTAIDENRTVMNQVASHVNQYHDGRNGFFPPSYSETFDENCPPTSLANATTELPPHIQHLITNLQTENQMLRSNLPTSQLPLTPSPHTTFQFPQQNQLNWQMPPLQQQQYQPPPTRAGRGGRGGRGGGRARNFSRGGGRGGRRGYQQQRGNYQQQRGPYQQQRGNMQQQRYDTSQYCWTHGACVHGSPVCNNPVPDHQCNATFQNKMGGSLYYCPNAKAQY